MGSYVFPEVEQVRMIIHTLLYQACCMWDVVVLSPVVLQSETSRDLDRNGSLLFHYVPQSYLIAQMRSLQMLRRKG